MMVLQHNLLSMFTNRSLGIVTDNKSKNSERLASGYRVNRASDDAAGLSISEKMRSQIRGLTRASENVEDAINYVHVADGALSQVDDMLQRMRELAVQASNVAVNTEEDRQKIQDEIGEIRKEIGRVFADTEFNKKKIWDPDRTDMDPVQIGTERKPAIKMNIDYGTHNIIDNVNRAAIPSSSYKLNADENGVWVTWKGYDNKDYSSKVVPYQDNDPTKPLSFNLNDHMDFSKEPESSFINSGMDVRIKYDVNEYATAEQVIAGLNSVYIGISNPSSENVTMYNSAGNPGSISGISASASVTYSAELKWDRDMEVGDTSFMNGSVSNVHHPTSDSDTWKIDFTMKSNDGTTKDVTATLNSITYHGNDTSDSKQNIWWKWDKFSDGTPYRRTLNYSAASNLGGFKSVLDNTDGHNLIDDSANGGQISMTFSIPEIGSLSLSVSVNGSDDVDSVLERIKSLKGIDVYNSATSNADGVSLASRSYFYNTTNRSGYNQIDTPIFAYDGYINEYVQAGANELQGIELRYRYLDNRVIGINSTKVDSLENAQSAIVEIDNALNIIAEERGRFGAYENRFEYTAGIDRISAENLQDAESRIRDTDMSEEMTKFAKENIIQQAGVSMLSQASQSGQSVLQLLTK